MQIPSVSIVALVAVAAFSQAAQPGREGAFRRARENARSANEAFSRSRRFVDGWLQHADPKTGLIPRNLSRDRDVWNARDSAADNYPFMVLTAAMTDRPLFEGRMLDMLRTETRLTSRIGRLPDTWSFSRQDFHDETPDLGRIIFGSSEYCKDGLLAVTEWLGSCPWTDRMVGIVDDIWQHAPEKTPYGNIPSTNVEVNGEMLQVLSRLYWMTGDGEYLEWAIRLGDYYLLGGHHPTRDFERLRLRDHGCEIVSGLSELYAAVHFARPEKKQTYREPIHAMFDRILEVGRNEHGLFYNFVNPKTGETDKRLCDTWGYNYNGIYTVYLIDGTDSYRAAVRKALGHLNEHYRGFAWGGQSVIADEYADSIEGAINLFNRERVASTAEWIDSEIRFMFKQQRPDGVIEGWHGDGNSARTWLMYALWKTQGLTIRPWRTDVRFGAVERDGTLFVVLAADAPWSGRLVFDKPRHRVNMNLPLDYPRLNQFPEWFPVDAEKRYAVRNLQDDSRRTFTGEQLQDGLPVTYKSGEELQLVVGQAARGRAGPIQRSPINWAALDSPILFRGDATTAYRDPAAIYHDGVFRLYFSLTRREDDGKMYWYTAVSKSTDLLHWSRPRILTPKDRNLNFSSPGNIVRYKDEWLLCLQTYPTPNDEIFGNKTARVWIMRSTDLETWSEPEMLRVKGPDCPVEKMGRMIDPYLLEDKDSPGKWWCFYKQNGVSMSYTHDFKTWTYFGRRNSGENVCVLVDGDEYVLFHSPRNGIGVKRSKDMKTWRDVGEPITLGQKDWPWAQGRLTAGAVLDLRAEPRVGRYVMFFHGSSKAGLDMHRAHGHGTLALAWSDDLENWHWPGKESPKR